MYLVELLPNFFAIFIYLLIIPEGDFSGSESNDLTSPSSSDQHSQYFNKTADVKVVEEKFQADYKDKEIAKWNLTSKTANKTIQLEVCALVDGRKDIVCKVTPVPFNSKKSIYCVKFLHKVPPLRPHTPWGDAWPADFLACRCFLQNKDQYRPFFAGRNPFFVTKAPANGLYIAMGHESETQTRASENVSGVVLIDHVWLSVALKEHIQLSDADLLRYDLL